MKNTRIWPVLLSLALVTLVPTSLVAQQSLRGSVLPSDRMLQRHGLVRAWWGQASLDPGRSRVAYITLDEDILVVQSTGGSVTGFNSETGRRLWSVQLGSEDAPSKPAVANSDLVFVAAGRTLFCLDKFNGQQLWEIKIPKMLSTSPTVDEQQIFFASHDGSVFAFDFNRIRKLFETGELKEWGFLARQWRYKTGKQITTPPISVKGALVFASRDNSLYCLSSNLPNPPKLLWQSETTAPTSAPMVFSKGALYVASEDFNLYCLDIRNGNSLWRPFPSGFPIRQSPQVIGKQVFVLPENAGVYCLSSVNGERIWWRTGPRQFVGATATRLFVTDSRDNVLVLDRADGTSHGTMPMRQFGIKLENNRSNRLYMATNRGLVICLREAGDEHEFPIFHMNPDLLPIVPGFSDDVPAANPPAAADPAAADADTN